MKQHFIFLWAYLGFLHKTHTLLGKSWFTQQTFKIFFNDKSFLMDIFNQKTSSGFCLLFFFFFSFTKTDFHLYWRLLQRGWDFSLHVFHMSDLKQQGKNKGKLGNAFYCNVCSLSHCRSLIIYLTNLCHKWYSWFCLWTKEGIKASQNCFQPYFSIL